MDMEVTAWMSLHHAMNAEQNNRPFSMATLRRIGAFARPHRKQLVVFLMLSVVSAVLAVATPVLAGRVVDAIVRGDEPRVVVILANAWVPSASIRVRKARTEPTSSWVAGLSWKRRRSRSRGRTARRSRGGLVGSSTSVHSAESSSEPGLGTASTQ